MEQLRVAIEQLLGTDEIPTAPALDHVGGERPGTAGKSDKGHTAIQLATNQPHRVQYIRQVPCSVQYAELLDVGGGAQRLVKARTFPLFKVKAQAQRIRNGKNVGKENRGVQIKAGKGLQGHFTCAFRIPAQAHEISGPLPDRTVFGQIASGLTHQPDRRCIHRLSHQGA